MTHQEYLVDGAGPALVLLHGGLSNRDDLNDQLELLQGDDAIVTLEHGLAMVRAIPDAQLAVVPGTSHTVPYEKPALVAQLFLDFLGDDPPRRLFTAEALGV